MQTAFMTPQALAHGLRQSATLIRVGSLLRVAAMAQSVPYAGSWNAVRFDWSDESERADEFTTKGLSPLVRSLPG